MFTADPSRPAGLNPLFGAVLALSAAGATQPAGAQERQVVSNRVTVSDADATLSLEFDSGPALEISFQDGEVRVDGEEVGSYQAAGSSLPHGGPCSPKSFRWMTDSSPKPCSRGSPERSWPVTREPSPSGSTERCGRRLPVRGRKTARCPGFRERRGGRHGTSPGSPAASAPPATGPGAGRGAPGRRSDRAVASSGRGRDR